MGGCVLPPANLSQSSYNWEREQQKRQDALDKMHLEADIAELQRFKQQMEFERIRQHNQKVLDDFRRGKYRFDY